VATADSGPLPITADDATWGDAGAPVTIVLFSDMECPYCDQVGSTLEELRQDYGRAKIRIVHKHFPLAAHPRGARAAEVGSALRTLLGPEAFFTYERQIFRALKNDEAPLDVAEDLGADRAALETALESGSAKQKVAADVALGQAAGVEGTPAFFVNGVFLSGAKPKADFAALIDEQLALAQALQKKGLSGAEASLRLTRDNYAAKAGKPGSTVWQVPIDKSPQLGPNTALVTWVMFSEYQCQYCEQLMGTMATLRKKYQGDLRVVFKHNPLSFHQRADEAAELAVEAFTRRGNDAFWRASDKLFATRRMLSDVELEAIASDVGLNAPDAMAAVLSQKHKEVIENDQLLANDLDAGGTPTSFINGRRIRGNAAVAKFEEVIDEEIQKAKLLLKRGIARNRLYDHIMKSAKAPPPPPTKTVPLVDKNTPVDGSAKAKVTVQVFVDFESGFWLKSVPAVDRLLKEYAGRVRIAFRHKPLPYHTSARLAHETAVEAFAQKGHTGFWKMYRSLVDNPHDLSRNSLLVHAEALGMDVAALEAAWRDQRHGAVIDADIQLATDRQIASAPAFLINGFYLSGARSFLELKRVVDLALKP
jgi:protein-disulfide isomerase